MVSKWNAGSSTQLSWQKRAGLMVGKIGWRVETLPPGEMKALQHGRSKFARPVQ